MTTISIYSKPFSDNKFTSATIPSLFWILLGISSSSFLLSLKPVTVPSSFFPIYIFPPCALAKPHIHLRYSLLHPLHALRGVRRGSNFPRISFPGHGKGQCKNGDYRLQRHFWPGSCAEPGERQRNEAGLTIEKCLVFQLVVFVITISYSFILTKALPKR